MRKMNKGFDPINSMAIEISHKNYNNEWLFRKEQVLLRQVVGLTIGIALATNILIYINLYLHCNELFLVNTVFNLQILFVQ